MARASTAATTTTATAPAHAEREKGGHHSSRQAACLEGTNIHYQPCTAATVATDAALPRVVRLRGFDGAAASYLSCATTTVRQRGAGPGARVQRDRHLHAKLVPVPFQRLRAQALWATVPHSSVIFDFLPRFPAPNGHSADAPEHRVHFRQSPRQRGVCPKAATACACFSSARGVSPRRGAPPTPRDNKHGRCYPSLTYLTPPV